VQTQQLGIKKCCHQNAVLTQLNVLKFALNHEEEKK